MAVCGTLGGGAEGRGLAADPGCPPARGEDPSLALSAPAWGRRMWASVTLGLSSSPHSTFIPLLVSRRPHFEMEVDR